MARLARNVAAINKIIERVDARQFPRMGKADTERIYSEVGASWRDTDADLEERTEEDIRGAAARSQKELEASETENRVSMHCGDSVNHRSCRGFPRSSSLSRGVYLHERQASDLSFIRPVRTRGYSAVGYLSVVSRALRPARPSITPFSRSYTTIYHVTKNLLCTRA